MACDYLFKYIIIGARYTGQMFQKVYDVTIGFELGNRIINVDGKDLTLRIYDTAGQRSSDPLLNLSIEEQLGHFLFMTLPGNKNDLESRRAVSKEEGEQFAKENGLLFLETSAKTAQNVEEAFRKTPAKILQNVQEGVFDASNESSGIKVGDGSPQKAPMIELRDFATSRCCY